MFLFRILHCYCRRHLVLNTEVARNPSHSPVPGKIQSHWILEKIGNVIGYPMYSGNPPMQIIKQGIHPLRCLTPINERKLVTSVDSYKGKKFRSELPLLIWKGCSMHQKPVDACTNCTGWKFGNSGNDWKSIPGTEFRSFSKSLFLFSCCLKSTCCCKRLKYLQYLKNGRYHWYYGSASFN